MSKDCIKSPNKIIYINYYKSHFSFTVHDKNDGRYLNNLYLIYSTQNL